MSEITVGLCCWKLAWDMGTIIKRNVHVCLHACVGVYAHVLKSHIKNEPAVIVSRSWWVMHETSYRNVEQWNVLRAGHIYMSSTKGIGLLDLSKTKHEDVHCTCMHVWIYVRYSLCITLSNWNFYSILLGKVRQVKFDHPWLGNLVSLSLLSRNKYRNV